MVVLDAGPPGHGASTRNAGYVGRTLKHGFGELMESHGLAFARAIYGELMEAFVAVKETVEGEKIACHYRQQGRFLMATSPATAPEQKPSTLALPLVGWSRPESILSGRSQTSSCSGGGMRAKISRP